MKIRRFVARDMRTALIEIKEELGADAVIMSNKKIPEGVELMAAVDYSQANTQPASSEAVASQAASTDASAPVNSQQGQGFTREIDNDTVTLAHAQVQPQAQSANVAPAMAQQASTDTQPNNIPNSNNDSLSALLNRKVQQTQAQVQGQTQNHNQNQAQGQSQPQAPIDDIESQFKNFTDRLQNSTTSGHEQASPANNGFSANDSALNEFSSGDDFDFQAPITDTPASIGLGGVEASNSLEMAHMKKEMASIRQLLEHQLSGLMWQDMAQKDPSRALLVNRLMALGLTEQVADQVAGYVPSHMNEQDSWKQALKFVGEQINTTNNDVIHRGGVVALVGPTGVGKTTTIAKLAARFAQIHGADQVAMISTDSYRIAGFEQLVTYGRIIGCQVKLAQDDQSLDTLLQQFAKKKLVLIDTAGMGQRDMRLANHLATLITNARVKIRNYLVLAANTQQRVMQENVERFKKVPLSGCIYTKLDESLSVGEIISTSIQNGLPIGYLTDGQRVPEDIKVANAVKLVTLADKMSAKYSIENTQHWNNVTPAAMSLA